MLPYQDMHFSLEPGGRTPEYSTDGSAGLDFFACMPNPEQVSTIYLPKSAKLTVSLGVRVIVPKGYALLLLSRSGDAFGDRSISLTNCVGLIDSDYRGVVAASLEHKESSLWATAPIVHGAKVCQGFLVPAPKVVLHQLSKEELLSYVTDRGEGGFGSTGS